MSLYNIKDTFLFKMQQIKKYLCLLIFSACIMMSQSDQIELNQVSRLKDNNFVAFRKAQLDKHNEFRVKHHVPKLILNDTLNAYAQKWAQNLAQLGTLKHSSGAYGQNLYYVWSSPPSDYKNGAATQSWYNEIKAYNFSKPGFTSGTGHFTQVVWKSSLRVGFGIATSKDGRDFIVASYDPPGNYLGKFPQNVLPI